MSDSSTAKTPAKTPVVAVMGPTASGKSALAIELAVAVGGEIVCADSATVYRGCDVGTAKPDAAQRRRCPHHLLDLVEVDETFTLALFQKQAEAICREVSARGRLPIVTGGTGLYIRALLHGYTLPEAPPDQDFRRLCEGRELSALVAELAQADPEALHLVDLSNPRRVVRALEVIRATGQPFSSFYQQTEGPLAALKLALIPSSQELRARIERRTQQMLAAGWLEEVRDLAKKGLGAHLRRLKLIGYCEVLDHLEGRLDLAECQEAIVNRTWRYSKRQLTWLRSEPGLVRLDPESDPLATATDLVHTFLSQAQSEKHTGVPSTERTE